MKHRLEQYDIDEKTGRLVYRPPHNPTLTRLEWTAQNVYALGEQVVMCMAEGCEKESEWIINGRAPNGTPLMLTVCPECSKDPHKILGQSMTRKAG